jgi:hypothetical protein
LSQLKNLKRLNLYGATSITDQGLPHLRGLRKLETLNVSGSQVTEAGIAELKDKLRRVEVVNRETIEERIRKLIEARKKGAPDGE